MPSLTPDAWAQIRYDYEHTDSPVEDICAEHGISSGTLRDRMRRWRWTRRRSAIPREGPPACLVVEPARTPAGTAVIVAKPPLPARGASTGDASPRDGAAAIATFSPPAVMPRADDQETFVPLSPALQEAVATALPALQRMLDGLADGRAHPDDAAKTARALQTLTRTLRELSGLSGGRHRGR